MGQEIKPVDMLLYLFHGRPRTRLTILKDWEIIADRLSKAGWSLGCVSAIDSQGRTIWIVDAHRDDGKRFIVRGDEILSALLELERQG